MLERIDENLPEDERGSEFRVSKLKPKLGKQKRKELLPTSGIDRIRILNKKENTIDLHARFNYETQSFEGNFTIAKLDSMKIFNMLKKKHPHLSDKKLEKLTRKYLTRYVLDELRKLYRKKRSVREKMYIPDSIDITVNENG